MRPFLFPLFVVLAACSPGSDVGSTDPDGDGPGGDGGDGSDEAGVAAPLDLLEEPYECDFWAQDCDEGEKCVPMFVSSSGDYFGLVCVPAGDVPGNMGLECCRADGPDCPIEGPVGTDTCDASSICEYVGQASNRGLCFGFCVGDSEDHECPDPQIDECAGLSPLDAAVCFVPVP